VVPGSAYDEVVRAAAEHGVAFTNLPPSRNTGAVPLQRLRVGTSAPSDEVFALGKMGFALRSVNAGGFNEGTYAFSDFDALYVSTTGFDPRSLNPTQQEAFAAWLESGGAVVGRGASGVTFNSRAGLLPVTSPVPPRNDVNGIVAVMNDPASPITGRAPGTSFVNLPRTFVVAPDSGVRVDQRLGDEGFFLAGHWRANAGQLTQAAAAGQPVVVSGKARGANVTLFGTEPLYRAHPEGLHQQVAEALWQAGR
jgi:hypothetical protein